MNSQVHINPAYRSSELRYALNLVGVKVLVMADEFRGQSLPEVLKELLPQGETVGIDTSNPQLPELNRIISMSDEILVPGYQFGIQIKLKLYCKKLPFLYRSIGWSDLLNRATPELIERVRNFQNEIKSGDPSNIIFTSVIKLHFGSIKSN